MWKIDHGRRSGTTGVGYTAALDWPVAELGRKTMLLKDTDTGHSLKYRLFGYATAAGIAHELVAETVLNPAEVAEFHYDRQWYRLELQVAEVSGPAAYQIDFIGQGA
jgi:hypothetical protein